VVGGTTSFAQIVRSNQASFIICSASMNDVRSQHSCSLYLEIELYRGCSAYIDTIPANYQEDYED
jgi:hypothetical protein